MTNIGLNHLKTLQPFTVALCVCGVLYARHEWWDIYGINNESGFCGRKMGRTEHNHPQNISVHLNMNMNYDVATVSCMQAHTSDRTLPASCSLVS